MEKKMKIAIVCDALGEANNGTSLAAYNLINTLKEKGHEVRVVCGDEDKRGLPGFYILKQFNLGKALNRYVAKNGVSLCRADKKIYDEAFKDIDAVHVMFGFSAGQGAVKYCMKHKIPVTCGFHCQSENFTAHVFSLKNPIVNWAFYKAMKKHFYKNFVGIHYPTEFIKQEGLKYGIKGRKGYVISNGVRTNIFYPRMSDKKPEWKNKYVIVMSGRYTKEKDQPTLLKAMKYSKYKNKIQIVFAGQGPTKHKLEKLANKLGIKPYFHSYTHEELAKLLSSSDLYVHTSYAEIEAISCLEAISCGLVPVISDSKKSATSKFALSTNNLFRFHHPKDLAKKIDYWIEHSKEKQDCKEKYADFVKDFEFNKCMDEMEKMIIDNYNTTKFA